MRRIALAGMFVLATMTVAIAGLVGGRKLTADTVLRRATDVYCVRCNGGERTVAVAVAEADIDMKVSDKSGKLVDSDTDLDGVPSCVWTPARTQTYRIIIMNATPRSVDCVLGID